MLELVLVELSWRLGNEAFSESFLESSLPFVSSSELEHESFAS